MQMSRIAYGQICRLWMNTNGETALLQVGNQSHSMFQVGLSNFHVTVAAPQAMPQVM